MSVKNSDVVDLYHVSFTILTSTFVSGSKNLLQIYRTTWVFTILYGMFVYML